MLIKNTTEFINFYKTRPIIHGMVRGRIFCLDGFSFSCQCGYGMYSLPKHLSIMDGEVTHFELGFPTKSDDLILEYAEDRNKPTKTIYPFVPIEVVIELINKHGGINTNN
jgi:hypothetical protein